MKKKYDTYSNNYDAGFDQPSRKSNSQNVQLIGANIAIAVISVVAIISLLLGTFWSVDIEYNIDGPTLQALFSSTEPDPEDIPFDFESLDINVSFALALAFPSSSLMAGAFSDNQTAVSAMLDDALANILDTATNLVGQVFRAGIKYAMALALEDMNTNEEIAQIFEELDLEPLQDIINELFENSPDTAQIESDLITLLQTQMENAGETFTPEMEAQIRDSYNEIITTLSDEEGNFSVYSALDTMLEEAGVQLGEGETGATEEELMLAVRNQILTSMDPEVVETAAIVYKVIATILIFTIALWALLLISSVFRIFSNRKGVKLWYVILWCALPYLLLVVTIKLAGTYGLDFIINILGEQATVFNGLSINASGNTLISAICVAVLIVFSIFFYGGLKKKAKRI